MSYANSSQFSGVKDALKDKNVLIIGVASELVSGIIPALNASGANIFGTASSFDIPEMVDAAVAQNTTILNREFNVEYHSQKFGSLLDPIVNYCEEQNVQFDHVFYCLAAGLATYLKGGADREEKRERLKVAQIIKRAENNSAENMPQNYLDELNFGFGAGTIPIIKEKLQGYMSAGASVLAITYVERYVPYPVYFAKDALAFMAEKNDVTLIGLSEFYSPSSKIFKPLWWKIIHDAYKANQQLNSEDPLNVKVDQVFNCAKEFTEQHQITKMYNDLNITFQTNDESVIFAKKFKEMDDLIEEHGLTKEYKEAVLEVSTVLIQNFGALIVRNLASGKLLSGKVNIFRGYDALLGHEDICDVKTAAEVKEKRYR